ncbi:SseB family protein [Micromonospora sp. NPDC050397]|uniref:SseB family protein n=1 Tax=Micromonospora sp. NPDC050397 TaxID=3364279 RepID=UPI00384F2302
MTEWEPATEAEGAMRDALRANDQERYFRILARTELLLPISADALAGHAPMGWGTWTTNGRTHVLAFTSVNALRACLGDSAGPTRRTGYHELAGNWPNLEWWLAVNPGLPVEGYLPAWFVSQLARGDVRLPGRTIGARARLERAESAARARATAAVPAQHPQAPESAGEPHPATQQPLPTRPSAMPSADNPAANGGYPGAGPRPDGSYAQPPAGHPPTTPPGGHPPFAPPPGQSGAVVPEQHHPGNGRGADAPMNFFTSVPRSSRTGPGAPGPAAPGPAAPGPAAPVLGATREPSGWQAPAAKPTERPVPPAPTPWLAAATPIPDAEQTMAMPPPGPAADLTMAMPRPSVRDRVPAEPPLPATAPPLPPTSPSVPLSPAPYGAADPGPTELAPVDPAFADYAPTEPDYAPTGPDYASAEPGYAPPGPGYASAEPGYAPPGPDYASAEPVHVPTQPVPAATEPAVAPFDTSPALPEAQHTPFDTSPAPFEAQPAPFEAQPAPFEAQPGSVAGGPVPEQSAFTPLGTAYPEGLSDTDAYPEVVPAGSAPVGAPGPLPPDFVPANDVERSLLAAAGDGSTDTFLSTLLLARVLLPVSGSALPGTRPGDEGFVWNTERMDGETYVVVFTSPERLADHLTTSTETVSVKFVQVIRKWPETEWSFAVNPGTPVGAKLPGSQIVALANWAAEVGLGDDTGPIEQVDSPTVEETTRSTYAPAREDPGRPTMMQKTIAPSQVIYYLERGYDRVSGFVHRAPEVAHLNTPAKLYAALGLGWANSPFARDADEIYLLRWPAYRPSLYRIPYGGQNEAAMRAMEGWVIERPPFRGNGFAPGESSDVVAEFKVDSARLPHGAELWRIGSDGSESLIATFDADAPSWQRKETP